MQQQNVFQCTAQEEAGVTHCSNVGEGEGASSQVSHPQLPSITQLHHSIQLLSNVSHRLALCNAWDQCCHDNGYHGNINQHLLWVPYLNIFYIWNKQAIWSIHGNTNVVRCLQSMCIQYGKVILSLLQIVIDPVNAAL